MIEKASENVVEWGFVALLLTAPFWPVIGLVMATQLVRRDNLGFEILSFLVVSAYALFVELVMLVREAAILLESRRTALISKCLQEACDWMLEVSVMSMDENGEAWFPGVSLLVAAIVFAFLGGTVVGKAIMGFYILAAGFTGIGLVVKLFRESW